MTIRFFIFSSRGLTCFGFTRDIARRVPFGVWYVSLYISTRYGQMLFLYEEIYIKMIYQCDIITICN